MCGMPENELMVKAIDSRDKAFDDMIASRKAIVIAERALEEAKADYNRDVEVLGMRQVELGRAFIAYRQVIGKAGIAIDEFRQIVEIAAQ